MLLLAAPLGLVLVLSGCQSPRTSGVADPVPSWTRAWKDLPAPRREARLALATQRLEELQTLAGPTFSPEARAAFLELEPRLFADPQKDTDLFPAFLAEFDPPNRCAAVLRFLTEAKPFLDNPASDRPQLKTLYPPRYQGAVAPGVRKTFAPGEVFSRYGLDSGSFLSAGEPAFAFRSIPGTATDYRYRRFRVLKPLSVRDCGRSAPWFGQPGSSRQIDLGALSVRDLLNGGFLLPILDPVPFVWPTRVAQVRAILRAEARTLLEHPGERTFSQIVSITEDDIYRAVRLLGFPAVTVGRGEAERRYGIKQEADGTWRAFYFEQGRRCWERNCPTREAARRAVIAELFLNARVEVNSLYKAAHPRERLPQPSAMR